MSVGVPVRNGERYVRRTVEDLLAQTVDDIEVVVCDNASTDGTLEVLKALQAQDDRLQVHSSSADLGPAANYQRCFDLARAPYFCWSAADDRHAPTFLERTLEALESDATAVVATTAVRRIGPDDEDLGPVTGEPVLGSPDPAERLAALVFVDHRRHGAHELFGLVRRDVLVDAGPQGSFARSDSVTLVRLALRGRFHRVEEELFFNREHGERSSRVVPPRAYKGRSLSVRVMGGGPLPPDSWWDPARAGQVVWPEWRLLQEYRRAVADAPLTADERARCRRVLMRFAVRHVPKLTRDVVVGAEFAARRAADRAARSGTAA